MALTNAELIHATELALEKYCVMGTGGEVIENRHGQIDFGTILLEPVYVTLTAVTL